MGRHKKDPVQRKIEEKQKHEQYVFSRSGKLTLIRPQPLLGVPPGNHPYSKTDPNDLMFLVRCDCGREMVIPRSSFRERRVMHCGCSPDWTRGQLMYLSAYNKRWGLKCVDGVYRSRRGWMVLIPRNWGERDYDIVDENNKFRIPEKAGASQREDDHGGSEETDQSSI